MATAMLRDRTYLGSSLQSVDQIRGTLGGMHKVNALAL